MTVERYLLGILVLALMIGPLWFAARRWRARLFQDFSGAWARLVESTLLFSSLLVIAEVLGTVGLFKRWPMTVTCLVVGLVAGLAVDPPPKRRDDAKPSRPSGSVGIAQRAVPFIAASALVMVLVPWLARVELASKQGVVDGDSAIYHLPKAARFYQTGSLTGMLFIAPGEATAYHPANSEVIHSLGMLAFGTDLISPFINLIWLALLLAAVWCVGSELGSPVASLVAVLPLLASPIARLQAGSADNDIAAVCFLTAAAALVLRWRTDRKAIAIAALAAGIAVGTKLTVIVPIAVLTIGVVILAPFLDMRRVKVVLLWLGGVALTGSFWYLRNLFSVGNPIPALQIGIGRLSLPRPPIELIDKEGYSVFHYLLDTNVWKDFFLPGLSFMFGKLWPVLVVAPLIPAAIVAFRKADDLRRIVSAAGLISFITYVFTPTTAFGPPGIPWLFASNLRYLLPALILIAAMLPASLALRGRRSTYFLLTGWLAVLITVSAPEPPKSGPFEPAFRYLSISLVTAFVLFGIWLATRSWRDKALRWGIALIGAAAIISGYWMQLRYFQSRYKAIANPIANNSSWVKGVSSARIGYAGFFFPYPLYGRDLSNWVEYIGRYKQDGSFVDYSSCRAWRSAINAGRYDYVALSPPFFDSPAPFQIEWTRSDFSAQGILVTSHEAVFRIRQSLDPSTCRS